MGDGGGGGGGVRGGVKDKIWRTSLRQTSSIYRKSFILNLSVGSGNGTGNWTGNGTGEGGGGGWAGKEEEGKGGGQT